MTAVMLWKEGVDMMRYGFEHGGYGLMGGVGSFLMILFMLMIVALVVLGILALIRYLKATGTQSPAPTENALLILNERYAKGEINDEEFSAKKALLSKQ